MRHRLASLHLAAFVLISVQVASASAAEPSASLVIPRPSKVKVMEGRFVLGPTLEIRCPQGEQGAGELLAEAIKRVADVTPQMKEELAPGSRVASGSIALTLSAEAKDLGDEGYRLEVAEKSISIVAAKGAGLFYGVQTLRQLLPAHHPAQRGRAPQQRTVLCDTGDGDDVELHGHLVRHGGSRCSENARAPCAASSDRTQRPNAGYSA